MNTPYMIGRILVSFDDNEPHSKAEAEAYADMARRHLGVVAINVIREEESADISYQLRKKAFERVPRIHPLAWLGKRDRR